MFKFVRVAILLTVLIVVGIATLRDLGRVTDWDRSVQVMIYPYLVAGNNRQRSGNYLDSLSDRTFRPVEIFFERELERYGWRVERPVVINLQPVIDQPPPRLGGNPGRLAVALWSLKMRYWAWRAKASVNGLSGDVDIFIGYHPPGGEQPLDPSLAFRKAMIGLVNARTGRANNARNNIVIAHELLHLMGATDKYQLATGQPLAPEGLAEPEKQPLYPQKRAEIMAGRIAESPQRWRQPENIGQTMIGPYTAREIGLLEP